MQVRQTKPIKFDSRKLDNSLWNFQISDSWKHSKAGRAVRAKRGVEERGVGTVERPFTKAGHGALHTKGSTVQHFANTKLTCRRGFLKNDDRESKRLVT